MDYKPAYKILLGVSSFVHRQDIGYRPVAFDRSAGIT